MPVWGTPPPGAAGPDGGSGLPPLAPPGPLPPYGQAPYGQAPYGQAPHGYGPPQPGGPGYGYPGAGYPPYGLVQRKSAGVAMLLSWLWLGAGHLYLGRIGPGLALAGLCFVCVILDLTILGAVLGVPVWLAGFVYCLVSCSAEAGRQNAAWPGSYRG
jgi:TM2 domain-containing membrane protein YozV